MRISRNRQILTPNEQKFSIVPKQCVDGHFFPRNALPQHVIGEGRQAKERLQDGVHVTSVAQVGESVMKVTNRQMVTLIKYCFEIGQGL